MRRKSAPSPSQYGLGAPLKGLTDVVEIGSRSSPHILIPARPPPPAWEPLGSPHAPMRRRPPYGSSTRPTNRTTPVSLSRIRKMNGLSTVTLTGSGGADSACIMTAVAAAASVPASSTDTNALCTTSRMKRHSASPARQDRPSMPEKSEEALSKRRTCPWS